MKVHFPWNCVGRATGPETPLACAQPVFMRQYSESEATSFAGDPAPNYTQKKEKKTGRETGERKRQIDTDGLTMLICSMRTQHGRPIDRQAASVVDTR